MAAPTVGTWRVIDRIGLEQPIASTSTTQKYKTGTRIRCRDTGSTDYGEATFQYAKGNTNVAVGDMCVISPGGTAAIRTVARSHGQLGVAQAAIVASNWGWFQVEGRAICNVAANFAADKVCYLTGSAGVIDDSDSVVAGDLIYGARSAGAVDTNQALVDLNFPHAHDTDNA